MIGNRKCAVALLPAFAIISSAPPASAAQFDGRWRMVALTTSGHSCGPAPRRKRARPIESGKERKPFRSQGL